MIMSTVHVTKYSGEVEVFDESKLRYSLKNAGASQEIIGQITERIKDELYEGIPTEKIYREAFQLLQIKSQHTAGRYKLKEALFELGPTGYPFERFVGELLHRLGYETEVGVVVKGDCVSHEIDVIAHNEDEYIMVECKFHNRNENHCNVKVPLYIHSRFLDVKKNWLDMPNHQNKTHKAWIVTNTRFTSDAEAYGACVGLKMLGWNYPKRNGLKDLVERLNLHPITCLSSLNKEEKSQLIENDIIFCRQIFEDKEILEATGINPRHINRIAKETEEICNYY
jgi:Holliday junction resolvase-like predicted endonuclease